VQDPRARLEVAGESAEWAADDAVHDPRATAVEAEEYAKWAAKDAAHDPVRLVRWPLSPRAGSAGWEADDAVHNGALVVWQSPGCLQHS
jgi:hypothetical protein